MVEPPVSIIPGNPYFLVSEYMPGGTLRDLIGKQKGLTVERSLETLQVIGEVLEYVHSKGFVHLDIKPQNIVFRTTPTPNQPIAAARPTLIDFGICSKEGMAGGGTGTQWWSEPRRWPSRNPGDLTVHRGMDIYSVAMMFRYMLTGEFPQIVNNNGLAAPLHKALAINALRFEAKLAPEKRELVAKQLNALINSCLVDDPERRPSITLIRQRLQQVQLIIGNPQRRASTRRINGWQGALLALALFMIVSAAYLVIGGLLPGILGGTPPPPTPIATEIQTPTLVSTPGTATPLPPTLISASIVSTTATVTATVTAIATATETETSAIVPTATPLPPTATVPVATATPLPPPTSTAQPTATSIPTATSAPTPTSRPAPRPTTGVNTSIAIVTNLQKSNGPICGGTWRGQVTFRWVVDPRFRLPAGYGYDVVVWEPNKEDPSKVDGIMGATTNTEVEIDADSVIRNRNINTELPYRIAVFLGQFATPQQKYKRIHMMGPANCSFKFE